jgi:hypothetical protein
LYSSSDQIKEDNDMYHAWGRLEIMYRILIRTPPRADHFGDQGMDVRIILKWAEISSLRIHRLYCLLWQYPEELG